MARSGAGWIERAALVGLAGASLGSLSVVRRRLHVAQADLERERRRVRLIRQAIDEIDAAVGIFVAGEEGIRNREARALGDRAAVVRDPDHASPGPSVYWPDGTPVDPDDQVAARTARGEECTRMLQWFGEPGDQIAVSISGRVLRDPDGQPIGTVVVGWDVTDLQESIRVRDEFLATVSHELRTPLTSILGYLEILDDDPDADAAKRVIEVVNRNARTLKSRIDMLLTSRHVDGEHARVTLRATDVSALTTAIVEDHRLELERVAVSTASSIEPGVVAEVDPEAYRQVCDNLISNAVKYAAGATLHVRLQRSAVDELVVVVADTGLGMSTHDLRRAFDRFYRAESTARSAIPGMGVGLSVTRRLVELHGGTISIDSALGRGTTVRVVLPLRTDSRLP